MSWPRDASPKLLGYFRNVFIFWEFGTDEDTGFASEEVYIVL